MTRAKTLLPAVLVAAVGVTSAPAGTRDPTFRERVEAQRAIARVYHAHQIGARLPFEDAVPDGVLEREVLDGLRRGAALEAEWRTRVTPEMLAAEAERIARHTRFPDRLASIEAALGHDPVLVRECFVRPVLVDRLARSFFDWDRRLREEARRTARSLRAALATGMLDPLRDHPLRRVALVTRLGSERRPLPHDRLSGRRIELPSDRFSAWRAGMLVRGGYNGNYLATGGRCCACTSTVYHVDADGDDHGDPAWPVLACAPSPGQVADGTDCVDADAGVWAAPSEVLDLLFQDATGGPGAWQSPVLPGARRERLPGRVRHPRNRLERNAPRRPELPLVWLLDHMPVLP